MIELEEYARRVNIPVSDIRRKTKLQEIMIARSVWWLYLHSLGFGYTEIGRMFDRPHCTVFGAVKRINELIEVNDKYLKKYLEAIEY